MVTADTDVVAGVELGAALAASSFVSVDHGVTENLDAEALSLRVTTVAGGTAAFLVCHFLCSLLKIVT